jgi:RNA-directed DNA polymerase
METSRTGNVDDWGPVITEPGMPQKLIAWRQKLSEKAKQEKEFRFYSLYSLVIHSDTLRWAWKLVRRNHGAPGVDRVTFEQIEQQEGGVDRFLGELEKELMEKTYKAQPVRRVFIEKENGKLRPLGIPTIKDRVAQMAVKLIVEPIFEADFNDCSYGYLHWFEVVLLRELKRGRWAAGIVRYADDFVILASNLPETLKAFIEEKLEGWMGLRINREKTRCLNLREEGQRLDFLGYGLRYVRDLQGRPWKYLNVSPSPKAIKRERAKVRAMTDKRQCFTPIPELIEKLNRQIRGWANYYDYGYPRQAFRNINRYVGERLTLHLNRRSQRKYKLPAGLTYYQHLSNLGLITL